MRREKKQTKQRTQELEREWKSEHEIEEKNE